jgi:nitrite reductase/ring-hydroxylating ferredoxin subunit
MHMPDHRRYAAFAASRLPHVGTYRRVLPVSLERLYENALDWERLPYVHRASFASVDCKEAGPWGWRAATISPSGEQRTMELRLYRDCHRWITRTLEGVDAGSEVWTHAFAVASRRTDVVVDFFAPGVDASLREQVGVALSDTCARLYDEDVAMMVERQRQMDERVEVERGDATVCLGTLDDLVLPLRTAFAGRSYWVSRVGGELIAHVVRCPHWLGPLNAAIDGTVTCPWHGYRFDTKSGACLTGQSCRLPPAPKVSVRDGRVWLER